MAWKFVQISFHSNFKLTNLMNDLHIFGQRQNGRAVVYLHQDFRCNSRKIVQKPFFNSIRLMRKMYDKSTVRPSYSNGMVVIVTVRLIFVWDNHFLLQFIRLDESVGSGGKKIPNGMAWVRKEWHCIIPKMLNALPCEMTENA